MLAATKRVNRQSEEHTFQPTSKQIHLLIYFYFLILRTKQQVSLDFVYVNGNLFSFLAVNRYVLASFWVITA